MRLIRRLGRTLENTFQKMSETVSELKRKHLNEDTKHESKKKKKKGGNKPAVPQMQGRPDVKRKVAMLIGYNGKGYYGIQRNPPFPTIEEEILKALLKVGAITQEHFDKPGSIGFQRAARTDKHVSAANNILSLKMLTNIENFKEKIHKELPEQIRMFGIKRTTKGFDAKNHCAGRTYMYVMPTYALAPVEQIITDEYRAEDKIIERVNDILKMYIGTHNFHNFTSGVKPDEMKARRYIISFTCSKPYIREDMEFVTCKVRGQSFMIHHIRKMIGLMIGIVKGYCDESAMQKSWGPEKVDIPKAPGLGLLLDELYFDGYNKKWGCDGLHEPLEWSDYKEEMEKFKEESVLAEIYKTEKNEKIMMKWLGTLSLHTIGEEGIDHRPYWSWKTLKGKASDVSVAVVDQSSLPTEGKECSTETKSTGDKEMSTDIQATLSVENKSINTNLQTTVEKKGGQNEAKEATIGEMDSKATEKRVHDQYSCDEDSTVSKTDEHSKNMPLSNNESCEETETSGKSSGAETVASNCK